MGPDRTHAGLSVTVEPGFPPAIDAAASVARPAERFLNSLWFAASHQAFGGRDPRTVVLRRDGAVRAAWPLVGIGPPAVRGAQVPGNYWPLRIVPVAADLDADEMTELLRGLARAARAIKLGPLGEDHWLARTLLGGAAQAAGWSATARRVAPRFDFRLDRPGWPRGQTLQRNRYLERKLAQHGALGWEMLGGEALTEPLVAELMEVERRSWMRDSPEVNFLNAPLRAFWTSLAADSQGARMLSLALLRIDGRAAAYSLHVVSGDTSYVIGSAYDEAVGARSPGKLLAYRQFVHERETRGVVAVDWGAGDSGYKARFGAVHGSDFADILMVPDWLPVTPLIERWWRQSGNRARRAAPAAADPAHAAED
jgi:hypothetical protein